MTSEPRFPQLLHVVLDCVEPRSLAEFYRQLLGLVYRPGDETTDPLGDEWLVLRDSVGRNCLAFQQTNELAATTWPESDVPQQLHLDTTVTTVEELGVQSERAMALGARLVLDRSYDEAEPLRVFADPAGHTFCIFVAPAA
jgi:hypothetical protein